VNPPGARSYLRTMQTMVPVGADKIWAEDSGGSGPVLVLLHEGVGDSRMWDPLWPSLTERFRAVRYDVRGYGRSPAPTEQYVFRHDLQAVLAHFGITEAHFAGCSMGGATAVDFALAEPARVRSLVLLSTGISGYPWPEEPEVHARYEALTEAADEDGLVELCLEMWGAAGPDPFVADLARSAVRAWAYDRFEQEAEPAFDRLGELRPRAVLLVGDKDNPALIACVEQAAARIPNCQLIRMPGVDHYPTIREPRLVLETILRHCGPA
jgi:3-oxoadipate enol-lactonase